MLLGAGAVGAYAGEITKKKWVGWVVGVIVGIFMYLLFMPAYDALKRVSCRGSEDYHACMGDD